MARAKKAEAKTNFKEFNYDGQEFKYTGRLYTDLQKDVGKITITPASITLNGVITVKGCKLLQTDNNAWIEFPTYKNKDGEYVSYFYTETEFNKGELAELVKAMEAVL